LSQTTKTVINLINAEGIPESLKQKISLIQSNGGKKKLDLEIQIIKKNDEQISNRFKEMWNMINEEQTADGKYRNMYGDKWRRPDSHAVNSVYKGQLENYQKKAEQASIVNKKIIEKYNALAKWISIVDED
jgi:hypothetical protein